LLEQKLLEQKLLEQKLLEQKSSEQKSLEQKSLEQSLLASNRLQHYLFIRSRMKMHWQTIRCGQNVVRNIKTALLWALIVLQGL
jgi:hypothetical protein